MTKTLLITFLWIFMLSNTSYSKSQCEFPIADEICSSKYSSSIQIDQSSEKICIELFNVISICGSTSRTPKMALALISLEEDQTGISFSFGNMLKNSDISSFQLYALDTSKSFGSGSSAADYLRKTFTPQDDWLNDPQMSISYDDNSARIIFYRRHSKGYFSKSAYFLTRANQKNWIIISKAMLSRNLQSLIQGDETWGLVTSNYLE